MFARHDPAWREILTHAGLTATELTAATEDHQAIGRSLAASALALGLIAREPLLGAVAARVGGRYVTQPPATLSGEVVGLVSAAQARDFGVVPLAATSERLDLLALDPLDPRLAVDLTFALDRDIRLVVSDPPAIAALLRRHYGASEDSGTQPAGRSEAGVFAPAAEPASDDAAVWSSQAPVVRYVDNVLAQAVHDHASDLHFEPFEREFKVRCRVDGALRELAPPAPGLAGAVVSRLKVLAGLNIAERRVPQDGRIRATLAGRAVDLRVSTLPTQFGESVVLRVLDREAAGLDLDRLGMPAAIRVGFAAAIGQPHGIVLVTGPTGSGKTTTLYGALQAIHAPGVKILTAEDPVEYEIDGVMQLPIQPAIGLTFAHALRAFLRQDPDVVMVGEIRDAETAQVAMQAALTGHLVLSTLHTNDAVSTMTRLRDVGIEPYLLASTVTGVLAQRLVRRLCDQCREAYAPTEAEQRDAGIAAADLAGRPFYRPRGCPQCGHTGYQGRTGVFEWLRCTESVRALIVQDVPAWQLREHAVGQGLRTLREHAREKLLAGETSLAEVLRHT